MAIKTSKKTYEVLTLDERTALQLSILSHKSSWEAGEIMSRSHYKYLEIKARATHFFKIFTEYFNSFTQIIPIAVVDNDFAKFINLAVFKRKPLADIWPDIDNKLYAKAKTRNKEIIRNLNNLKVSSNYHDQRFYHLIMEFDRWNKSRILPLSIQEPSAYKRRNKHKNRRLLKLSSNLNPLAIDRLKELYQIRRRSAGKVIIYVPIIDIRDGVVNSMVMETWEKNIGEITNLMLWCFTSKTQAERYLEISHTYLVKGKKHCTDGQKFWPEFRLLTKNALNFMDLQNINPSRRYLETAHKDMDVVMYKSNRNKIIEANKKGI